MNAIDWIIVIVLALFAFQGMRKGLLRELAGLVGILVAFVLSVRLLDDVSVLISYYLGISPRIAVFVSGILIFAGVMVLFILLAKVLRKVLDWAHLGWMDRVGGGAFGLLKGAVLVSILALLVSLLPLGDEAEREMARSALFNPVRGVAPAVFNGLVKLAPSAGDFYSELEQSLRSKSGKLGAGALKWLRSLEKNRARSRANGTPPSTKLER